ncbi:MAG TPA: aldose epimerase family protein, partial [Prolixibacteraceae bacterium]|nr:aldose epimerase family protein [Prolixibacteraceae bacterium]
MFKKICKLMVFAGIIGLMTGCAGTEKPVFTQTVKNIDQTAFSKVVDGKQVELFTLVGEGGIGMKVTNFGARVVALCVPDANGNPVDVVLGFDNLDDYMTAEPETFYGASIGRYGNRIANGRFQIDSVSYQLAQNNGINHLHGGPKGYFDVVWDAKQVGDSKIIFTYLSPDGEEGYPGNLEITMIYELTEDNAFKIEYAATTDKATVCNLTHHSFFNLNGEDDTTINDHVLRIDADYTTPVDAGLIPDGTLASVEGTPFDFNQPTAIGERLDVSNEQLDFGSGYDHNWVLNRTDDGMMLAATLFSAKTGIQMEVITDQPGLQFYGGNFLDGTT